MQRAQQQGLQVAGFAPAGGGFPNAGPMQQPFGGAGPGGFAPPNGAPGFTPGAGPGAPMGAGFAPSTAPSGPAFGGNAAFPSNPNPGPQPGQFGGAPQFAPNPGGQPNFPGAVAGWPQR